MGSEMCIRDRYADRAEQIQTPDLLILPGTKNTIDDLKWLRRTGLESPILNCARKGIPVLGICGGYQMLGNEIDDSCGAETGEVVPGLGLLPVKTVFSLEKHRTRVKGRICAQSGIWGSFRAVNVPVMKSIWARAVFAKKMRRDLYSLPINQIYQHAQTAVSVKM